MPVQVVGIHGQWWRVLGEDLGKVLLEQVFFCAQDLGCHVVGSVDAGLYEA